MILQFFYKSDDEHLGHLQQTFEKCRKYGLSFNPKKSHFDLREGILLEHIVSKEGIKIDPKHVEAISNIPLPMNKKEV